MNAETKRGKPAKNPAVIEAFKLRLNTACDSNPNVPGQRGGRYPWLKEQFDKRFGVDISIQAISKWFVGENVPTPTKVEALAEILGVDAGWLMHGSEATMAPREQRAHNALAGGSINVVAGLIQMDGGTIAFPEDDGEVHLHAIIRGVQYGFHVAAAQDTDAGLLFRVPRKRDAMIVLGLVRREGLGFDVFEIPHEMIEEKGRFNRGMLDLVVTKDDEESLRRLDSFKERL